MPSVPLVPSIPDVPFTPEVPLIPDVPLVPACPVAPFVFILQEVYSPLPLLPPVSISALRAPFAGLYDNTVTSNLLVAVLATIIC